MTSYDLQHNVQRDEELSVREKERSIAAANQNSSIARIINIVYFLFGILELLLAVRVVLKLIGANAINSFASVIYGISQPFVALFASLLQDPKLSATSVLEITTIIGMVAYAILAYMIGRLIWLALSRPR